jgi:hypothetical protein
MDERKAFRLYVSSDSSASYYTVNTKSKFWVHLANPIRLEGVWEVGLTELFTCATKTPQTSAVYVYCNLSVKVPVSDSMSRCLRILPPFSNTAINSFNFDRPYFERVEFAEFQDISLFLLDNSAQALNLADVGVVTHAVLYFRPR